MNCTHRRTKFIPASVCGWRLVIFKQMTNRPHCQRFIKENKRSVKRIKHTEGPPERPGRCPAASSLCLCGSAWAGASGLGSWQQCGRSWPPATLKGHRATCRRRGTNQQNWRQKVPPSTRVCHVHLMPFLDHSWPRGTHLPSPVCLRPSPGASGGRTPAGDEDDGGESGQAAGGRAREPGGWGNARGPGLPPPVGLGPLRSLGGRHGCALRSTRQFAACPSKHRRPETTHRSSGCV